MNQMDNFTITFRGEQQVKEAEQVRAQAKKEGVSINKIARRLFREWLKQIKTG